MSSSTAPEASSSYRFRPEASREISDAELVIRQLYAITSDYALGLPRQLRMLLELGLARFNLDIGIVARIEDDAYTVVQAISPDETLHPGMEFEFARTFCVLTVAAEGPVGFTHAGASDLRDHPCYQDTQLEAYIGTPIRAAGEVVGTLNFSSATARSRAFLDVDVDALQLMASWVGGEISRRRAAEQIATLEGLIPICSHCRRIRTELGDWTGLEAYVAANTQARFSHGICPTCMRSHYAEGL